MIEDKTEGTAADMRHIFSNDIVADSIGMVRSSQESAYRSVNRALLIRIWLLGRRISDEELTGDNSEKYGKQIIRRLSSALTESSEEASLSATSVLSSSSIGCSQGFCRQCLQDLRF
ncbi:MAG: hypothetical protein J5674_00600 [Candidatus Methanomethylophilaceae archaeon]|nr:hypothetical protein [Candidatus Methanomethylophilaceae archaeon]